MLLPHGHKMVAIAPGVACEFKARSGEGCVSHMTPLTKKEKFSQKTHHQIFTWNQIARPLLPAREAERMGSRISELAWIFHVPLLAVDAQIPPGICSQRRKGMDFGQGSGSISYAMLSSTLTCQCLGKTEVAGVNLPL